MRLPNARQAIVDDRKITHYLLSRSHPDGAPKAAFFESFGFRVEVWPQLRDALFEHAQRNSVSARTKTQFGDAFEVTGGLETPDGRNPRVLVVWFVRTGERTPRLVTAVPA